MARNVIKIGIILCNVRINGNRFVAKFRVKLPPSRRELNEVNYRRTKLSLHKF